MEKKSEHTCPKGTKYTLMFNGLYYWSREGNIAKSLEGTFTSAREAIAQFNRYSASLIPEESQVQGDEDLEELTKKVDLVKWAEEKGIEIPSSVKQPAAIKKFLLEKE